MKILWWIDVYNANLNKFRRIQGYDKYLVEQKAAIQAAAWDEQWQKKIAKEQIAEERRIAKERKIEEQRIAKEQKSEINRIAKERKAEERRQLTDNKQEKLDLAKEKTNEAVEKIRVLEQILIKKFDFHEAQIFDYREMPDYVLKDFNSVIEYYQYALKRLKYPINSHQDFDLHYNPDTKIIVIDYELPSMDDMPRIKEVKFNPTRDEFVEIELPDIKIQKLYDNVIYQICLRTIYEIFDADVIDAIDSVVFNGWVTYIDKATGKSVHSSIISLLTTKQEFLEINLENIEPKACFKKLRGTACSTLYTLTPIAPIMNIEKEDKRFVSSYEVVGIVDDSTNIAAMDWEDFEHLIREIFEKEFAKEGGEVKVTQASRDGGVDAVVFDPDPLRGGKIVIQAKRYTNTVGVSAVRDLYGTLMNEGANKGILVTTSDYGSDAYEFVKGKPLTLLNGNNLLYLLEKHGHKAKIDIREAKEILTREGRI